MVSRAGTTEDTDAVVTAMEQTEYDGVLGRLKFNESHVTNFGYTVCEVRGGAPVCAVVPTQ